MRIAFNSLFSTELTLVSINAYFERADVDFELVDEDDAELDLVPLHLLSMDRERSFSVFSLLSISERRNFLLIRRDEYNSEDRLGLPEVATILASHTFVPDKILTIRKNLHIKYTSTEEVLKKIQVAEIPIAIVEACFLSKETVKSYHIIKLDEREFGHAPGQGFLALTGPDEHAMKKFFRRNTVEAYVQVCNIERKMAQLSDVKINNHCELDRSGNLHLWAISEKGSVHISQSTRLKMEERALAKMVPLV